MFMNFADFLSTLAFIGFGACGLGAIIDYCDWFVIGVMGIYLILAIIAKMWAIKMYRSEIRRKTLDKVEQ